VTFLSHIEAHFRRRQRCAALGFTMTMYYDIGSTAEYGDHICYLPDRETKPIFMECSIPHMAAGAFLTPQEALEQRWAHIFREARADWFRPLLSRLAAGEHVTLDEIKKAYKDARGTTLPKIEDPRDLKDNNST
jgi:hypothetical protein